MGDLFNSLIAPGHYSPNHERRFYNGLPGGDIEVLNLEGENAILEQNFFKTQTDILKNSSYFKHGQKDLNAVNNFFEGAKKVNKGTAMQTNQKITEEAGTKAFKDIIKSLNSYLASGTVGYRVRLGRDQKSISEKITKEKDKLEKGLESLGFGKTSKISKKVLNLFNDPQFVLSKNLNNVEVWDNYIQQYMQEKASVIEDLVTEFLRKQGFYAFNTGALYTVGKQCIQDSIGVPRDVKISSKDGLWVRIETKSKDNDEAVKAIFGDLTKKEGVKNGYQIKSLRDLERISEKAKDNKISLHIPDELYDYLETVAELSIQIKSGSYQDILNNKDGENIKTSFALGDLLGDKYLYALYLLDQENKKRIEYSLNTFFKNPASPSDDLALIANHALSNNIMLTLLVKNNLYITSRGVTTAAGWMEETGRMLVFESKITRQFTPEFFTKNIKYFFKSDPSRTGKS